MLKSRKFLFSTRSALAATILAACVSIGCGDASSASNDVAQGEEAAEEDGGGWSLLSFGADKEPVVIPAGQSLRIRTASTLSSKTNQAGESFVASLEDALVVDGATVAPAGSRAVGTVAFVERSGRVKGVARIGVKLTEIHANGTVIPVATDSYVVAAKKTHVKDAQKVGIGAGVGAAIGAIAGGGDGALKGAGAGAGAGTGAVLATRGDPAVIGSESVLTFTLQTQAQAEL